MTPWGYLVMFVVSALIYIAVIFALSSILEKLIQRYLR